MQITKEQILANFDKYHVYPGTNPNITQEEIAQQIADVINELSKPDGDYEIVTDYDD